MNTKECIAICFGVIMLIILLVSAIFISELSNRTAQSLALVHYFLNFVQATKPEGFWSMEQPIGRLPKLIPELGKPVLYFDPCDFGDAYTKRTCLWGKFNTPPTTA